MSRTALEIALDPTLAVGDIVRLGATGKADYVITAIDSDEQVTINRSGGKPKTIDPARLFLVYPNVQPDELDKMTLIFATETCRRCGGDGRYASTVWNGRCYGCSGRTRTRTAAAHRAHEAHKETLKGMDRPAAEVKVGDRMRWTNNAGYETWRTVVGIEDTGMARSTTYGTEGQPGYAHHAGTSIRITTQVTYSNRPGVKVEESVHIASYDTVRIYSAQVMADAWTAALHVGGCWLTAK